MQLFLDSCDPREISTAKGWGVLDGVTTNPTLFSREGGRAIEDVLRGVLDASPGPVLCQAIGWEDKDSLIGQARWLHAFSEKIIVKLPMSVAGIQALLQLKKEARGIRIAVTLVSSIAQAYIVGKSGADIVALFNGPLDQALDQEVELVAPVRRVYDNYGFPTKILSCGRYPRSFGQFAVAGTDICTLRFEYLALLYEHPFTEKRMRGFMADWEGAFGKITWPSRGE
ncbi:MAG: transaldolase family protein [Spirochaetia bacterium]